MSIFKYLFANPLTLLVVFSILENAMIIILYTLWGKNTPFSIWRLLCCILLSIALMTITFKILFTSDYQKSQVEISPIAALSYEQINQIENVMERFREYSFITRYDITEASQGHFLSKSYSLYWNRKEPASFLDISIFFYKDEKVAIDNLQLYKEGRYTLITNNNNTEALLFDSKMQRNSDSMYISNSQRYIRSKIRLGNAIINLSEFQEYYNLDKNISSEFIKLLCELLKEEN